MKKKGFMCYMFSICLMILILSGCGTVTEKEQEMQEEEQVVLRFFHYQGEAEAA